MCFVLFLPRGVWDLSSPNRAQSCIPSIGRWGLKHWTAREVHSSYYFNEQTTLSVLAIYLWKYAYTAMNFSLKPEGLSHPCALFDIIYVILLATLCSRYCSSIPILHRRKWKHIDVKYFSHGHTAWKWQSQDLNSDHGALPGQRALLSIWPHHSPAHQVCAEHLQISGTVQEMGMKVNEAAKTPALLVFTNGTKRYSRSLYIYWATTVCRLCT